MNFQTLMMLFKPEREWGCNNPQVQKYFTRSRDKCCGPNPETNAMDSPIVRLCMKYKIEKGL
jgi:hypothetical protein